MNITLATKTQNDGLVAQQKLEALERGGKQGEPVPHKYSNDEKDDLDHFIRNNGTANEESRRKKEINVRNNNPNQNFNYL